MPSLSTHLWFHHEAEEAVAFYRSIFPELTITERTDLPDPELSLVRFELFGQRVTALNAHAHQPYNESFSFLLHTADQAETDRYWAALTADGGREQPCGWLTDRFGIYWQVTPIRLTQMIADPDRAAAGRAMQAMFRMKKIVIADLERAFAG